MATKVLMVCLGNICRSPLAEGILGSMVDAQEVIVDSAGTAGYHVGSKPDERSILVARKYGIDISHQRCRQFHPQDFKDFDIIYAMDQSNYRDLVALGANEEERQKVKLLLEASTNGVKEVPDPYYGSGDGFERVFHMIHQACEEIAKDLGPHKQRT